LCILYVWGLLALAAQRGQGLNIETRFGRRIDQLGLDEGFCIFSMSNLGFAGGVVAADGTDDAAVDDKAVGGTTDALEEIDGFPLALTLA
jgi:hypothetical protein